MMGTDWGIIASIISAAILIAGTLYAVFRWGIRKIQIKNPYDVYYEPEIDAIKHNMIVNASRDSKYLQVTLRVKTEVNVERVSLKFEGVGEIPQIKNLYDWNWGLGITDPSIFTFPVADGSWYWRYNSPIRRFRNSRIKIGIRYIAINSFSGELKIGFTAAPGESRYKSLLFEVREI